MLPRIRGMRCVALVVTLMSLLELVVAARIAVDDADAGITYSPVTAWNIGNACSVCLARPTDLSSINAGTWHDATRDVNSSEVWFEYKFTGDSVTVYGILVDIVRTTYLFTTNVDLTINLDGQDSGYKHTPLNTESYQYQVPVFSKQGLSNSQHTIRVTLNPASVFLFDYLVYTTPDTSASSSGISASTSSSLSQPTTISSSTSVSSSSSLSFSSISSLSISIDSSGTTHTVIQGIETSASSNSSNTVSVGTIAGIVGGVVGVLLIIIIILVFLLCRKRRRNRQNLGPQALAAPESMAGDRVSDPLMQSAGPSAIPHMSANHASASDVALHNNHNLGGATPFDSSNNLSTLTSSAGGNVAAVAVAATTTINSKQRRLLQEQALLPAQQPQQHNGVPAWVTTGGGGGGTAYSEGSGAGGSVYGGMEDMSSHTGPMSSSSGMTDYDTSSSTPLSRRAAPGVGGRVAPWNTGLYAHGVPSPVPLAAPMPVPLGVPLGNPSEGDYAGRANEARSRSAASGLTRPPTAPPPYIRSPPPLNTTDREEVGPIRVLGSVSEYEEKR